MTNIIVCYFVFNILKWILVIFNIVAEEVHAVEHFVLRVAETGWVPGDWPELAESIIFIPCLLLDGILLNCDWVAQADIGNLFNYDGLVIITFDVILFLKREFAVIIKTYKINYRYKVLSIFYAGCDVLYQLYMVFLFLVLQLQYMASSRDTGINTQQNLVITLLIACAHPVFSRYTSMCNQGIKAISSNKRLREAPKVRLTALNLYIRWFWFHPIMLIFNLFVYGCVWFMYVVVYKITAQFFIDGQIRPEWFVQGSVIATFIVINVFTLFFMINLAYATLKRFGVFFARCFGCPCSFPADCSTYAKSMNKSLAECNASFRMNSHMCCD